MDEESNNFITNNFDDTFKNNGKAIGGQYTHQMKEFALILHYYSARADNYCHPILSLPDPSSITSWTSSVNVEPGFFPKSL
ncbi:THAP domain-containing protein 2-like [Aphis craccivora]|uniref:THAP domain-containing protein 2-like n=1 Tax=Aphis craccivora TaxID=307492 RepID=A0A6G0YUY4_APHCR|nr:THAP domain-containing protein 2-like [Aphis craccivora]